MGPARRLAVAFFVVSIAFICGFLSQQTDGQRLGAGIAAGALCALLPVGAMAVGWFIWRHNLTLDLD